MDISGAYVRAKEKTPQVLCVIFHIHVKCIKEALVKERQKLIRLIDE